jgi:PKD repeat protein
MVDWPPQWGWCNCEIPIQLASAVQGFPYLETPFWTRQIGEDLSFYLLGDDPVELLVANANGPYETRVGEGVILLGSVSGGRPPYFFHWNVGESGWVGQMCGANPHEPGIINVSLTITDVFGTVARNETIITVAPAPIEVRAGGPYEAVVDELILFKGIVFGGTPPFNYTWDFGDGTIVWEKRQPFHSYAEPGVYTANFTVRDQLEEASDETTVTITAEPDEPELIIREVTDGNGIRAVIANTGAETARNVDWHILFDGGIIFRPPNGVHAGTIDSLDPGEETVISGEVFGFGGFFNPLTCRIYVSADNADSTQVVESAKLFFSFIRFI